MATTGSQGPGTSRGGARPGSPAAPLRLVQHPHSRRQLLVWGLLQAGLLASVILSVPPHLASASLALTSVQAHIAGKPTSTAEAPALRLSHPRRAGQPGLSGRGRESPRPCVSLELLPSLRAHRGRLSGSVPPPPPASAGAWDAGSQPPRPRRPPGASLPQGLQDSEVRDRGAPSPGTL